MTIRVTNTRCIGIKITDLSYDAEIIKINKKSIRTNKGTFTLRKVFEDGTKLYKNALGHSFVR